MKLVCMWLTSSPPSDLICEPLEPNLLIVPAFMRKLRLPCTLWAPLPRELHLAFVVHFQHGSCVPLALNVTEWAFTD